MSTLLDPARSAAAASPSRVAVSLRDVCKSFPVRKRWSELLRHPLRRDLVPVVQSVSCDIRRGEFFGLLGPNGAGKTTLFKMLATLVLPDSGSATVAGFDVVREPAAVREALAPVMADERSLNWRLSARENLNLFAALHRFRGAQRTRRVTEVLEAVELADTADKLVGTFSSGMKQRLLLARALLSSPSVLLLDEPTRSLDPVSARRFRSFLREELVGRLGCTVLLATHSSDEALELCDRVGVLHRGRLLAVGTADHLAAEIRGEYFAIWTQIPNHAAFAALQNRGWIRLIGARPATEDDWGTVEIEVLGDLEQAAEVNSFLTSAGVPIARFERVKLPLADLIEQIVVRHAGPNPNA